MFVPGLTFNKEGLAKVGKDSNYNMFAYILVIIYALIIPITDYYSGVIPPASGLSGSGISGLGLFLGLLLKSLIDTFLFVFFICFVAKRLFGGNLDKSEIFRVYAASLVWYYIAYILSLFIELSFGFFVFFFIFHIVLMLGLTKADGSLAMWKYFLIIILAFVLGVLVNHLIQNYVILLIFT